MVDINPQVQESQRTSRRLKTKKTIPKNICENQEKNFKSNGGKKTHCIKRRKKIKLMTNFLKGTMEVKKQ